VSHDRAFMDNVVTSIIACEATDEKPGFWREYEGSVQDWLTQSQRSQAIQQAQNKLATNNATKSPPVETAPAPKPQTISKPKSGVKLSYKEQKELEGLPSLIESLEKEQQDIREAMADSSLFAKDPAKATALFARDAQIDEALLAALERWEVLSAA
jgi:ATP-binding cassette subfamily F protein uup